MFHAPIFSFWNLVYTGVGALVFWGKWCRTKKLKAYYLSDIVRLLPFGELAISLIELGIFIALGCIIGIGVVQPTTATQALAAGFGWTGFFAHLPGGH